MSNHQATALVAEYDYREDPLYKNFEKSIKSKQTRISLRAYVRGYMKHHLMQTWAELLQGPADKIQERIIHYVVYKQEREKLAPQSVANIVNALYHFYWLHKDKVKGLDWEVVRSFLGEFVKTVEDRPYSRDEFRRGLDHADPRQKVPMCLEGKGAARIGGHAGLNVEDLESRFHPQTKQKMYKITVYRRTKDEYYSFCDPEGAMIIDSYLTDRLNAGEVCRQFGADHFHGGQFFAGDHRHLDPKAPLIRDKFKIHDKFKIAHPKRLSTGTLERMVEKPFVAAGVRKKTPGMENCHKRKEVMLTHGLRKFCRQEMRRAKVDPILIEYLLGHDSGDPRAGVTKLMMTYDPEDETEVFTEYCKAIDNLTIYDENKLRRENAELQAEVHGSKVLISKYELIQSEFRNVAKLAADSQKQIAELEKKLAERDGAGASATI